MKDRIMFKKGFKYQLVEDYIIRLNISGYDIRSDFLSLNSNGLLLIKKGYAWDGPSGPTVDTKTFMRGSLIHDAIYQLIREKKLPEWYRGYADYVIKEICLEDKMCKIRAWWVYKALASKFADFASDPKNKRKVIEAP